MNFIRVFPLWILVLGVFQLSCGRPGGAMKRLGPVVVILGLDGASEVEEKKLQELKSLSYIN